MLKLVSKLYGFGAYLRRNLYTSGLKKSKKLPVPVVSIGNLSTGGTGKTPFTIFLSKEFQKRGFKVCVLSRGYKRRTSGVVVVSDGEKTFTDWESAGDEPYLIGKEGIPVVVSEDRYRGGMVALEKIKPDIFILDDGFQHFQLHRDVDILLIDATRPFWEDDLLPVGNLREPVDFYKFADFFIVNRLDRLEKEERNRFIKKITEFKKPFFITGEKVRGVFNNRGLYSLEILKGKKVGLFSGLGNNLQFFQLVKGMGNRFGFQVVKELSFPDHFDYRHFSLPSGPDIWITTQKDIIKIPDKIIAGKNIYGLKYSVECDKKLITDLEKMIFDEKI